MEVKAIGLIMVTSRVMLSRVCYLLSVKYLMSMISHGEMFDNNSLIADFQKVVSLKE